MVLYFLPKFELQLVPSLACCVSNLQLQEFSILAQVFLKYGMVTGAFYQ